MTLLEADDALTNKTCHGLFKSPRRTTFRTRPYSLSKPLAPGFEPFDSLAPVKQVRPDHAQAADEEQNGQQRDAKADKPDSQAPEDHGSQNERPSPFVLVRVTITHAG